VKQSVKGGTGLGRQLRQSTPFAFRETGEGGWLAGEKKKKIEVRVELSFGAPRVEPVYFERGEAQDRSGPDYWSQGGKFKARRELVNLSESSRISTAKVFSPGVKRAPFTLENEQQSWESQKTGCT